ncbi:uncharacterized protein Pyn_39111 [Prunus yedoensis var. nudiflora]|uniref:Uncharacterized protein n=1 Tax=Prunus yedoensis var. nudiflora TaxID=2094558 RepID=A0A314ZN68_PRUYE|nr:uncharacterized protein Pyn_39111 [Prunus yedoensis var. nudiflora]
MISWYAKAEMRMTEGCSLEQELAAIKQQAQPAMAQLKENDLVVQRENEELVQVEAVENSSSSAETMLLRLAPN